jgi:hypothetical protein
MSAITDLIGGIVSGLGETAIKIRTAITGIDPAKQAEITALTLNLEAAAAKAQTDLVLAQAEINKIEAGSTSKFVSWWRPGVAWTCVFAFALNYLVYPILSWGLKLAQVDVVLPQMDIATMVPILVAMLGLGAYRTIEKSNGSTK